MTPFGILEANSGRVTKGDTVTPGHHPVALHPMAGQLPGPRADGSTSSRAWFE